MLVQTQSSTPICAQTLSFHLSPIKFDTLSDFYNTHMMDSCKKSSISKNSYNSLYVNPLTELRHSKSYNCDYGHLASKGDDFEGFACRGGAKVLMDNKENVTPNKKEVVEDEVEVEVEVKVEVSCDDKENVGAKKFMNCRSLSSDRILKPTSLEFCMQMNDSEKAFGSKIWDRFDSEKSNSVNVWDFSDSEAAPASSWSTLPNK